MQGRKSIIEKKFQKAHISFTTMMNKFIMDKKLKVQRSTNSRNSVESPRKESIMQIAKFIEVILHTIQFCCWWKRSLHFKDQRIITRYSSYTEGKVVIKARYFCVILPNIQLFLINRFSYESPHHPMVLSLARDGHSRLWPFLPCKNQPPAS